MQNIHKVVIQFIVALAIFMEAIDSTIINTAIPKMAESLHVHPIDLKLALISYLVTLAIFIPISGWMADKYGVKKVFITAIIVFTVSSFWCGLTNSLMQLIIGRCLQGLGGSFTLPIGRLIMLRTFGRRELVNKMGVVIMVASVGMMLGPLLGGIITERWIWRWIFWVNIPVGIFNALLAYLFLPTSEPKAVPHLDKKGFIYFGSGLATMTVGMTMLSESEVKNTLAFSLIAAAFFLISCYFIHSRHQPHPIVKIGLFRIRTFQVSMIGNILSRVGFGGVPFLLPLLLQIILGYSPEASGYILAPTAIGVFIMKPFSVFFLRLIGYKRLLIANTIIVAAILFIFSYVDHDTSRYVIMLMTFIYGFFIALQFSGMNSLAYAKVKSEDLSAATSIVSTVQQLAQSFGVAVAALFIRFFMPYFSTSHTLVLQAFHLTFIAMSFMTFFSVLIFLRLQPQDGRELI